MNKEIMAVPSHWRPFAGGGAGPGQACGLDLDQGAARKIPQVYREISIGGSF
jgi:hypothetical protein